MLLSNLMLLTVILLVSSHFTGSYELNISAPYSLESFWTWLIPCAVHFTGNYGATGTHPWRMYCAESEADWINVYFKQAWERRGDEKGWSLHWLLEGRPTWRRCTCLYSLEWLSVVSTLSVSALILCRPLGVSCYCLLPSASTDMHGEPQFSTKVHAQSI